MEVAAVEVVAETMVVLMALYQIASLVISSFFPGESKIRFKEFSKKFSKTMEVRTLRMISLDPELL